MAPRSQPPQLWGALGSQRPPSATQLAQSTGGKPVELPVPVPEPEEPEEPEAPEAAELVPDVDRPPVVVDANPVEEPAAVVVAPEVPAPELWLVPEPLDELFAAVLSDVPEPARVPAAAALSPPVVRPPVAEVAALEAELPLAGAVLELELDPEAAADASVPLVVAPVVPVCGLLLQAPRNASATAKTSRFLFAFIRTSKKS